MLDGKEYLVGPVVLAKVGVMNGLLMTHEEMTRNVQSWGDIGVPIAHPVDDKGNFITAKTPEVLEKFVVGRFLNPYVEANKLKGEMWIDVEKAESTNDGKRLLEALKSSRKLEVSSGFFADIEEAQGQVDGTPFFGIWKNIVPDHAAILLDEIGACSCEDGCGFPCVNAQKDFSDSVMIALYPSAEVAAQLALSESEDALNAEDLHVTLAYLGKISELQEHYNSLLTTLLFFAQKSPVVRAKVNGVGRFMGDGEEQPHVLLIDSLYLSDWRSRLMDEVVWSNTPLPIPNHAFNPHITLAYFPSGETINIEPPEMEIIFDAVTLSWGDQITHFQLQGEAAPFSANESNEDLEMNDEVKEDEMIKESANDAQKEAQPQAVESEDTLGIEALQSQVDAFSGFFERLGGMDKAVEIMANAESALVAQQTAESSEREELAKSLQANAVKISDEDIKSTPITVLRALAGRTQPVNYVGNGAPVQVNTEQIAKMPSVLLAKKSD